MKEEDVKSIWSVVSLVIKILIIAFLVIYLLIILFLDGGISMVNQAFNDTWKLFFG